MSRISQTEVFLAPDQREPSVPGPTTGFIFFYRKENASKRNDPNVPVSHRLRRQLIPYAPQNLGALAKLDLRSADIPRLFRRSFASLQRRQRGEDI